MSNPHHFASGHDQGLCLRSMGRMKEGHSMCGTATIFTEWSPPAKRTFSFVMTQSGERPRNARHSMVSHWTPTRSLHLKTLPMPTILYESQSIQLAIAVWRLILGTSRTVRNGACSLALVEGSCLSRGSRSNETLDAPGAGRVVICNAGGTGDAHWRCPHTSPPAQPERLRRRAHADGGERNAYSRPLRLQRAQILSSVFDSLRSGDHRMASLMVSSLPVAY